MLSKQKYDPLQHNIGKVLVFGSADLESFQTLCRDPHLYLSVNRGKSKWSCDNNTSTSPKLWFNECWHTLGIQGTHYLTSVYTSAAPSGRTTTNKVGGPPIFATQSFPISRRTVRVLICGVEYRTREVGSRVIPGGFMKWCSPLAGSILTDFSRRLVHALHEMVHRSVIEPASEFEYNEAPSTNWHAWFVKTLVQPAMKGERIAHFWAKETHIFQAPFEGVFGQPIRVLCR